MKTYHYTLGFPREFAQLKSGLALVYSRHALEQATRKNIFRAPSAVPNVYKLVEVTLDHGVAVKYVIRVSHSTTNDLVLVVSANGTVITLWHNSRIDHHRTLDITRYARP